MLETFREHSKGWLVKALLALIAVTFALVGIESYLNQAGSTVPVAEVDGDRITVQEYDNAVQNLRYRLQAEGQTDPALLDDPGLRRALLDELIRQRLLGQEARGAGLTLSDASLGKYIMELPEFQREGQFSQERYDQVLAQNRLTPTQFEDRMRGDLLVQKVGDGVAAAAFLSSSQFESIARIERQQREVSVARIPADGFLGQVTVSEEQIREYYEKNQERFRLPEQVRIEFVLFSANNLIPTMQVTEEEMRKFYEDNAAELQGDEQRRASHILISFGVAADEAAKQAARAKAEQVLAEVRQNPGAFAELAKKYSQDPGSAEGGGDLGVFGRGAMVKPFEDAVFGLRPGEISGIVESEFGYHIIKLTEVMGQRYSFDDLKAKIRAELLYQKALARFTEQADHFSNLVYEQFDSLKPAAEALGLQVQTSPLMSRAEATRFFKNDKMVNAIFSDAVLKEGRNTEAVEVAPNTLMSARVVEHKPSKARALDEVKTDVESILRLEQANELASKKGAELLAALRAGEQPAGLTWADAVTVDRVNSQGLGADVVQQAFRADAGKLPAYAGLTGRDGYTLIRIGAVDTPEMYDEDEVRLVRDDIQRAQADEYLAAYLASLRGKAEIRINERLLGGNTP